MKIIDAFWEKRNLGVDCKEVILEPADSIEDLKKALDIVKNIGYIVFKVPSSNIYFIKYLTENGFYFIETLFKASINTDNYSIPEYLTRFDNDISYRLIPNSELDSLTSEIKKGIFHSDRIALDPHFGTDIAASRYINWIKDEVAKGTNVYKILFNGKEIGFFALKQTGHNSFYNFLAGIYLDNTNFGMGFSILSKPIEETKKRNGKILITHFSSNNISSLRLHVQFGFIPDEISYVMIKHN